MDEVPGGSGIDPEKTLVSGAWRSADWHKPAAPVLWSQDCGWAWPTTLSGLRLATTFCQITAIVQLCRSRRPRVQVLRANGKTTAVLGFPVGGGIHDKVTLATKLVTNNDTSINLLV